MTRIRHFFAAVLPVALFLLFSAFYSGPSANDCKIMQQGTFKYGGTKEEILVKIKGKHHTEYQNGGKYIIESDMDWVNDCEYNLTMTKVAIPNFPYKPGDVLNVKINRVDGDTIYYTASVKGNSWDGTFIKIK